MTQHIIEWLGTSWWGGWIIGFGSCLFFWLLIERRK